MQQILAAIGSRAELNEADDRPHEVYDWTQVRYFDALQIKAVEEMGQKATHHLANALKRTLSQEFTVELTQVSQTAASQYKHEAQEQNAFLAFQTENKAIRGSLALPTETTQDWVTRLLGASSESEAGRALSQLEITLLSDVAASLAEAFSACFKNKLLAQPPLTLAHMTTVLEDTEELCLLTFAYKTEKDASHAFAIIIPCSQLAQTLEGMPKTVVPSEGKLSQAMHEHINHVPVVVTAEFARTRLTLEQAMGLSVGDVLLLNKDLDDPMVLKINNRQLFYGKPAECENHYAVVITQNA